MKMKVYRVENGRGQGPYVEPGLPDVALQMKAEHNADAWDDKAGHPGASIDFECWGDFSGRHFGFATVTDAHRWFGPWLPKLISVGFRLVEFEVDVNHVTVSKSGKQLAFRRDAATLLTEVPI